MTNRLHILEREREQLELALADDPHWQAFCDAQRRAATADPAPQLSPEVLAGLTRSQPFAAYMEVVREIDRIQAAAPAPPPIVEHQQAPSPVPEQSPTPPPQIDDLTAIRRIDRALEKELNGIGIYAYQTIATWDRHQVRAVRDALQLGKRIWRENWIEQAALLHLRQADRSATQPAPAPVAAVEPPTADPAPHQDAPETDATAAVDVPAPQPSDVETVAATIVDIPAPPPRDPEVASVPPPADVAPPEPPAPEPPAPKPTDPEPPQDAIPAPKTIKVGRRPQRLPAPAARRFAYLLGVSDELSEELRAAGIKSIAEIAAWTRSDVRWFQAMLGDDAQISRDQWIEQAALLSRGHWTRHALRVVSGETRLLVPRPTPIAPAASAQNLPEPENDRPDETEIAALPPAAEPELPDDAIPDIEDSTSDSAPADPEIAVPASELPPPLPSPPSANAEPAEPPALPVTEQPGEPTIHSMSAELGAPQPARNLIGRINRPPPDLGAHVQSDQPPAASEPKPPPPQPSEPPPLRAPDPAAQFTSLHRPPPPSSEAKAKPPADEARPLVPPTLDTAPPEVVDEDDRSDAEALVIKRSEPTSLQAKLKDDVPPAPEPAVPEPPIAQAPPTPPQPYEDDDDLLDTPVWGDEADVVIVTRDGAKPERPASRPAPQQQPSARAERTAGAASQPSRPHVRLFDEDHLDETPPTYGNAVEEASVTIIRAEASQEDAASVVPSDIANDAEAPEAPKQKGNARALGSRFLKALTGN